MVDLLAAIIKRQQQSAKQNSGNSGYGPNGGNGGDEISAARQAYQLASQHEYYVAGQTHDIAEHKRAHQATQDALDALHKLQNAKAGR